MIQIYEYWNLVFGHTELSRVLICLAANSVQEAGSSSKILSFFTECWARGSSGWNISGCNWMFVGIWKIYTQTSKLVSKVNFVISVKPGWKIVWFFPLAYLRFSEWNIMYSKTSFLPNCCCLHKDIRTTKAVFHLFHFRLSKHKWSQYYKLKSVLSVAIVLCQIIPKNVLSVPKCSIWVSVGMIYFTLLGNII